MRTESRWKRSRDERLTNKNEISMIRRSLRALGRVFLFVWSATKRFIVVSCFHILSYRWWCNKTMRETKYRTRLDSDGNGERANEWNREISFYVLINQSEGRDWRGEDLKLGQLICDRLVFWWKWSEVWMDGLGRGWGLWRLGENCGDVFVLLFVNFSRNLIKLYKKLPGTFCCSYQKIQNIERLVEGHQQPCPQR